MTLSIYKNGAVMALRTTLGFSLAMLFCAAVAAEEGAAPLLDATKLSAHDLEALTLCTLDEMDRDRTAQVAEIKSHQALQAHGDGQPGEPLFSTLIDVALAVRLAQVDCAQKLGIDPKTLPEMKIQ